MSLIQECEATPPGREYQLIVQYLCDHRRMASNAIFIERLKGDVYYDNSEMARFILCMIEESRQTKEILTDLWARDKYSKYLWTIEHVFPEGENIPSDWVNMLAKGDKTRAKDLQRLWVHKLGNLTLTGYNPSLSNLSFEKKKDRQNEKGQHVGYKNGLYLNRDLATKQYWNESDIEFRTNLLVEEALRLFAIDS